MEELTTEIIGKNKKTHLVLIPEISLLIMLLMLHLLVREVTLEQRQTRLQ